MTRIGRNVSFSVDLLLNYLAFGVTAVGGIAFLFVCASYLGMAGLGVVSQVMALFVILGQLAVGGIQLSALHMAGGSTIDRPERRLQIWSAILAATGWATCVAVVAFAASNIVGRIVSSPQVGEAWALAAPALVPFALNKVCASSLIGLNHLRRFAVQMGLRAILLAGIAFLLATNGAGPVEICWAFLGAECLLAAYLITQIISLLGWPQLRSLQPQGIGRHLRFGLRGLWSGLACEVNLRLDVFMVGIFLNDAAVGLYGLVAQLAEGFFNLLVVLRNQLTPLLFESATKRSVAELRRLASWLLCVVVPVSTLLAVVGIAVYGPAVALALPGQGYEAGTVLLAILLAGLVINSWIMPLDTILVVTGNPGLFSLLSLVILATNVLLSLTLVPLFAVRGAATASFLATVLSGPYLLLAVRYRLGFWLAPTMSSILNRTTTGA